MIFNIWRKYPKHKPLESGLYLCSLVDHGWRSNDVMILYYSDWMDEWIDLSRQKVFDGYQVFMPGRGIVEETRVYSDGLCNRTLEVTSWRHVPRRKGWWWK